MFTTFLNFPKCFSDLKKETDSIQLNQLTLYATAGVKYDFFGISRPNPVYRGRKKKNLVYNYCIFEILSNKLQYGD